MVALYFRHRQHHPLSRPDGCWTEARARSSQRAARSEAIQHYSMFAAGRPAVWTATRMAAAICIQPNQALFDNPWCTAALMTAMRDESSLFFLSLLREDRPIRNLIAAGVAVPARHPESGGSAAPSRTAWRIPRRSSGPAGTVPSPCCGRDSQEGQDGHPCGSVCAHDLQPSPAGGVIFELCRSSEWWYDDLLNVELKPGLWRLSAVAVHCRHAGGSVRAGWAWGRGKSWRCPRSRDVGPT